MTARRWTRQHRPLGRQAAVVGSVLAVLASYGVAGPGAASAGSITGSSFEIDGDANLVVDGTSGALDWLSGGAGSAMRSGVLLRDDLPTGQNDDSFTQGTSEDDASTTITTGSIPNNKSDLTHFGVYVERYSAATFVNVFWTRVQDPSGTTNMDFEFNQSADRQNAISPPGVPLSTHTIPVRTPGDILISYDLDKGGTHPTLSRRTWSGSQWGPATVFDATQALGSINSSAIPANQAGGLGALDARTFGEASINLAALVPPSDACTTYGSVYVKSRASDSFTAEMKDFIAPESVNISNCGSVTVHKTDAHGALQGAGFTLYKDVAPTGGTSAGAEDTVAANVEGTCTTDAQGDCTISSVHKGSYWLVETTVPFGHDAVADQYVTVTTGDQVVPLSLDDPIQHGTITVTKVAVPADSTPFTFSLDGSAFSLADPATASVPSTRSFTVEVGTHTLTETNIPSSWANTQLQCTDPTSDTTVARPTATVNVASGETVACTYTDTYSPAAPGLTTAASEAVSNTSWGDTATLTGDGTHALTGTVAFYACDPAATATACTTGGTKVGADVAVSHTSGASYTAATSTPYVPAAAGWSCFRAEFTSTSPYYTDTTHTNATTECFLKHNADLTVSVTGTPAFGRQYTWTIVKTVDQARQNVPAGTSAAFHYTLTVGNTHTDNTWSVAGKVTVGNPNAVPVSGVDVTDAIDNGGTCVVTGGTGVTVPAGGSVQLDYTCSYAGTPAPMSGKDTATATWDSASAFTPNGSASGDVTLDFSTTSPTTRDQTATVTDSSQSQTWTVDAATDPNPRVITYTQAWPAVASTCTPYPNTATVTADDSKTAASSSQTVTVCGGSPLTMTQTAAGAFTRTYAWTLAKTGTPTLITNPNGSTGTFSYAVTVSPAGTTDSAWSLGGSLVVVNPNDWEDVVADVTVSNDLGFTCTVPGGSQVTIPRSGSTTLTYTCAPGSTPASAGTVTATVAWNPLLASTTDSATDVATPVTLDRTDVNRTVTVVDDKTDPANPVQLGTWTYDQGPHTFTYDLTKAGVDNVCTDYANVASIAETSQTATASVRLCHTFTGGGGTPVVAPTPTPTPHFTGGGGLPFTGAWIGLMARTAGALLAAGLLLLLLSRRRRSA